MHARNFICEVIMTRNNNPKGFSPRRKLLPNHFITDLAIPAKKQHQAANSCASRSDSTNIILFYFTFRSLNINCLSFFQHCSWTPHGYSCSFKHSFRNNLDRSWLFIWSLKWLIEARKYLTVLLHLNSFSFSSGAWMKSQDLDHKASVVALDQFSLLIWMMRTNTDFLNLTFSTWNSAEASKIASIWSFFYTWMQ